MRSPSSRKLFEQETFLLRILCASLSGLSNARDEDVVDESEKGKHALGSPGGVGMELVEGDRRAPAKETRRRVIRRDDVGPEPALLCNCCGHRNYLLRYAS